MFSKKTERLLYGHTRKDQTSKTDPHLAPGTAEATDTFADLLASDRQAVSSITYNELLPT